MPGTQTPRGSLARRNRPHHPADPKCAVVNSHNRRIVMKDAGMLGGGLP